MTVIDLTFCGLAKVVGETRLALSHLFPRAPESALRRCYVVVHTSRRRVAGVPMTRVLHWTVDGIMENWVPDRLLPMRMQRWDRDGWTRVEVGVAPPGPKR